MAMFSDDEAGGGLAQLVEKAAKTPPARKQSSLRRKREERELKESVIWVHQLLSDSIDPLTGYDIFGVLVSSGSFGKLLSRALGSVDADVRLMGYELCSFALWKHHGARLAIGPGPHFDKIANLIVADALNGQNTSNPSTRRKKAFASNSRFGSRETVRRQNKPRISSDKDLEESDADASQGEPQARHQGAERRERISFKVDFRNGGAVSPPNVKVASMETLLLLADELFDGEAITKQQAKASSGAQMRASLVKALLHKDRSTKKTPLQEMALRFNDTVNRTLKQYSPHMSLEDPGFQADMPSAFPSKSFRLWNDLNLLRQYVNVISSLSRDPECAKGLKASLPGLERVCKALSPLVVGKDFGQRKQDNATLLCACNALRSISAASGKRGGKKSESRYRKGSRTAKQEDNPRSASLDLSTIQFESVFGQLSFNSPRSVAALSWLHLPQNRSTWKRFGEDCSLAVNIGLPWGAARSLVSALRQKQTSTSLFESVMRGSVRSSLGAVALVGLWHYTQWSHKRRHQNRIWTAVEMALEKIVVVSLLSNVLAWSPFAFFPALASGVFNANGEVLSFYHVHTIEDGSEKSNR